MRAAFVGIVATVAIAVLHVGDAVSGRAPQPALGLVSFAPLTVRGTGFHARERVRVDAIGGTTARRRLAATASGSFVVRFEGVQATRCDVVRVIAVGSRGARAGLKLLPGPACMPA